MLVACGEVEFLPLPLRNGGGRMLEHAFVALVVAGEGEAHLEAFAGEAEAVYRLRLSREATAASFEAIAGLSLGDEEREELSRLMREKER